MASNAPSKATVRERAIHETLEFVVIAGYLYIAFAALIFFKAAVLQGEGITWTPWGTAAIKAALVAKFILIGRAAHVGERFKAKPLIWQTVNRSLVFLLVVLILTAIEEVVVGWIHGRGAWQSATGIGGGTLLQFIATVFLLFLIFFPYFALRSLGEVAGDHVLFRLFFIERRKLEVAER